MGAGGETLGLVGGGGTWEVTHRGREEESGGGVQTSVAVENLISVGLDDENVDWDGDGVGGEFGGLGAGTRAGGGGICQAGQDARCRLWETEKNLPSALFARVKRDLGDWVG